MHQTAARDAVGHDCRYFFDVCGLRLPDTIESFRDAFAILNSAQKISQRYEIKKAVVEAVALTRSFSVYFETIHEPLTLKTSAYRD
jgi:hypothetical protein